VENCATASFYQPEIPRVFGDEQHSTTWAVWAQPTAELYTSAYTQSTHLHNTYIAIIGSDLSHSLVASDWPSISVFPSFDPI
jgi:hypothetical protein